MYTILSTRKLIWKFLFIVFIWISIGHLQKAQESSAALVVESKNRVGIIPKMIKSQRNAIGNLATGLLIYKSSKGEFNFFDDNLWQPTGLGLSFIKDADSDTQIETEQEEKKPNKNRFIVGSGSILR